MVPEEIEHLGQERYLVTVALTARGKGSDVPVEVQIFDVWMFRGEKAIRRFASFDREGVLEAAGISGRAR